MQLTTESYYHIYNRGINHEKIFYTEDNYTFFLEKIQKYVKPYSFIFAYCLMPTHFHIIIQIKPHIDTANFKKDIGVLLRSYAQAINKSIKRSGSLFQQHTKAKNLLPIPYAQFQNLNYLQNCFAYVHLNPVTANLVNKVEAWKFSSYHEHAGLKKPQTCDIGYTREMMQISGTQGFKEIMTYYSFEQFREVELWP
mgnify:CR=1 FL=1